MGLSSQLTQVTTTTEAARRRKWQRNFSSSMHQNAWFAVSLVLLAFMNPVLKTHGCRKPWHHVFTLSAKKDRGIPSKLTKRTFSWQETEIGWKYWWTIDPALLGMANKPCKWWDTYHINWWLPFAWSRSRAEFLRFWSWVWDGFEPYEAADQQIGEFSMTIMACWCCVGE